MSRSGFDDLTIVCCLLLRISTVEEKAIAIKIKIETRQSQRQKYIFTLKSDRYSSQNQQKAMAIEIETEYVRLQLKNTVMSRHTIKTTKQFERCCKKRGKTKLRNLFLWQVLSNY